MRSLIAYNRRLRRYDPLLRLVFSPRRQRYLLERRATYARLSIDPDLYGRAEHDTVRQLRDGYHEIGSYCLDDCPSVERLIAYLRTQDAWRLGDQDFGRLAEAVADELDAEHERRRIANEQRHTADVGDQVGDLWDHLAWKQGETVTVPRSLPG